VGWGLLLFFFFFMGWCGGGRALAPLGKNNMKNREENEEQKWVCYICTMKKCGKKASLLLYYTI